jgi:hypothetical protein
MVYLMIFNAFINKKTHEDLSTSYFQKDKARSYMSNASMRKTKSFSGDQIIPNEP